MNLNTFVRLRIDQLRSSAKRLADIYRIMFSDPELICCEQTISGHIVRQTYGEINTAIRNTACSLSQLLAEEPKGSFVGLEMDNSPEWIASFWGLLMAGFQPLLVNDRLPRSTTDDMLRDMHAVAVLSRKPVPCPVRNILLSDCRETASADFEGSWANKLAVSTSATSLHPKVCVYSGAELSSQILNTMPVLSSCKGIKRHYHGSLKQLAFLPFYHVFGLIATYFWFAFFGRTFVFLNDLSGETILKTCRDHQVTHIFAVPLLWHTICREVTKKINAQDDATQKKFLKALALSNRLQQINPALGKAAARRLLRPVRRELFGDSVQFMISGGSSLLQESLELLNGLGYSLHVGYGMSELGITSVDLRESLHGRNSNSIGKPFPSVEYQILDESGQLAVRGESICHEIYEGGRLQKATGEWFKTGDLVRKNQDGSYQFMGRLSELIIGSNGENINPDQIEAQLKLRSCEAFSVLGLAEGDDEVACLVVQLPADMTDAQRQTLTEEIRQQIARLPSGQQIRRIYYTEDPLSAQNAVKISRAYLRRQIEQSAVMLQDYRKFQHNRLVVDENGRVFQTVRALFADILNRPEGEIDPDGHFELDLGGNSLDYLTLLSALGERFDIQAEAENQVYCYTVREFTAAIEEILKNR